VGLRFLPIVLDEGRINMKIQPEVTDLVGFTSVATTGLGATTLVPTLTTRRISTTVELSDGQSFAIGGLLQDNTRESIKRFPILGEIPILGALFRSTEFQKNKTELLIVVTPRLVKPLQANYILPTDSFKAPSRSEILLNGQLEGKPVEPATPNLPPESAPRAPSSVVVPEQKNAQDGFEMK
jgi:pilus assembly protein CpaC